MNKPKAFICFLLLSTLILVSCGNTIKDYDGNRYSPVTIGKQVWLAENLSVSHFRNGDSIPQVKSAEEWVKYGKEGKPAWCYMENNPENNQKFGKLYNWYAGTDPRGLAPAGWHIATDEEWKKMIDYLGGGVLAAIKMRTAGLNEGNGNEIKGFSGIPAGCRNSSGNFYGMDSFGYWWSGSESNSTNAWMRILNYVKCDINSPDFSKTYGASIRCIRD
jgi:uncharacterized protein (TIGR02145 family)